MSNQQFDLDLDLLAQHLNQKMESDEKSLRTAAGEIGCSPATLSRLLKGSDAENFPDTRTLVQAASWLGRSLTEFERNSAPKETSLADVVLHLRALPGIGETDKETLVAMVKAMHDHHRRTKKN